MLPEKFLLRMKELLKDEYPAFLQAIEKKSVRAMRVNPVKATSCCLEEAFSGSLTPVPYLDGAYVFDIEKIGNHPLHHAGAFYVQDPGAMATLAAVSVEKGWLVADFCAAPGGKTSQLSALVSEEGFVFANEFDHGRCKVLLGNLERLGVSNVLLTNTDTETLASWYHALFDLVLVDAPCSGEGMFRKYDYAQAEWSEEGVISCARLQGEILDNAARAVKSGGYLLYSTCTFSLEENEKNVDAFLVRHSEFSICEVSPKLLPYTAEGIAFEGCKNPEALKKTRRFYPHLAKGEGQYVALLRKNDKTDDAPSFGFKDASVSLNKAEAVLAKEFLNSILAEERVKELLGAYDLIKSKDSVFLKRKFPVPPRQVYMPGICLGTLQKGRLEPHHQLFSALGGFFLRQENMSLKDPRVLKYLRGETFETALSGGYAAVLVEGCALGGIKVVNGVAKNHYPKGLRLH